MRNSEQLKVIAEGVGHEAKVTPSRCSIKTYPYGYCPKLERWKLYNPLTNNDQMMEIMVACGISVYVDSTGDGRYVTAWDTDIYFYELYKMACNEQGFKEEEAAMIRRLVCKAAFEYFKQ